MSECIHSLSNGHKQTTATGSQVNTANQQHTTTAGRNAFSLPLLAKPALSSLKTKRTPASLNSAGLTHTQNFQEGNL
jgi:hypothetical protein